MSAALEARAEISKLSRLLGQPAEELAYLGALPPDVLRGLRERATDALFDADRHVLQRVASATKLVPVGLAATIAQRVLGPLLCARVAGELEPQRAADIASRLASDFLADVAAELDPRRVEELLARMPPSQIAEIARELCARGDFVAMGRFVARLTDAALVAAFAVIDDESLLRVAFVLEGKDRLDHVVRLVPTHRLCGVIRAAESAGLWPEAIDLVSHLGPQRRGLVADLAAREGDAVVTGLLRAADEQELWEVVLPLMPLMSEESRRRFASMPIVHDDAVLANIVRVAMANDLSSALRPLVVHLPQRLQERVQDTIG